MAKLVITNLSEKPLYIGELYADVSPGCSVEKNASIGAILSMPRLSKMVGEGLVALAIETSPGENALLSMLAAAGATAKTD